MSLYLPIAFERSLRVDLEPANDSPDGPYVQIDYILDGQERWPPIRQEFTSVGMTLSYDLPESVPSAHLRRTVVEQEYELSASEPVNLRLPGPGIIRRVRDYGRRPKCPVVSAQFDDANTAPDRLDGPFQIDAPLRDLVGPFVNAGVERIGTSAIIHFPIAVST